MPGFLWRGLCGYAVRFAKSTVKVAIGRKPFFYSQDLFFLAYLRHRLGFAPMEITCRLEGFAGEGGGSHALLTMIVIDFARRLGVGYVHTPFLDIRHADRPRGPWLAAWESLFNFGAGEASADGAGRHVFVLTPLNLDPIRALFGPLRPRTAHDTHVIPAFPPARITEFRRKYYVNKAPRRNARVTVGVHLRRFNAFDDNPDYIASLDRIDRTLADVRAVLERLGIEPVVRLFSQGSADDLPDALRRGAELHLDADPVWSLQELVEADILVSSRGSFSYVAGLLCDGIVICEAFYPPQGGWLVCADDGAIDTEAFAARLCRLNQVRSAPQ